MQKTSLVEGSSYCSGKGRGGEVGRWGGEEVLPAKERTSEEGRSGADRSWGIWIWVGQAMSKVMAGATMQRQRWPNPISQSPRPAFSHANSAPSVSAFPWFFWGSTVSFTYLYLLEPSRPSSGSPFIVRIFLYSHCSEVYLFNSLQTKHLERPRRGQHPLSLAPLPPSSSVSQQMLLTEAMLCALIISYGNSLSLSIKYLWQKQQNNATRFIPKYSAKC